MGDIHCDICDKDLASKGHRDRHHITMHPTAPSLYKCTENGCNERFEHSMELKNHVKSVHCMDYKCCGKDFKYHWQWNAHKLKCHTSYEKRATHAAPPQPDGENYLPKIYLFFDENGAYFKVGQTKNMISHRVSQLNSVNGESLVREKSWNLSKKYEEKNVRKSLETKVHCEMLDSVFKQLPLKQEYFYFNNRELEEKLIQDKISAIIKQDEQEEILTALHSVVINHIERPPKKRKFAVVQNPTKIHLQHRKSHRKCRENTKGPRMYCGFNDVNIVIIGHANQSPTERLQTHNGTRSHYGKFNLLKEFSLGGVYTNATKRTHLKNQIINQMRMRFELVDGSEDHFECSMDDHKKVIEIIEKIIKQNVC